jgi:AmmeMemoRadiSam system protein A
MTPVIDSERGRLLLALARRAIEEVLEGPDDARGFPRESWLDEPGATFVTLKLDGELRGCIGSLAAERPLGEDLRLNARSAAFRDPRFPPLREDELDGIEIEVSVLSQLEPLPAESEEELAARLVSGIDGLVLESGPRRGTFLPQVWEQLPAPRDFVRALKRKAGMMAGEWPADLTAYRYRVAKYREHDDAAARG